MIKKYLKYFIIFLVFINVFSCKEKKIEEETVNVDYPSMKQVNYKHYIYKNNKKYLYANIEYAEFFEKKETIECVKFNGEIYDSKGELTTIINSNEAKIDKKEKNILFYGDVVFDVKENETKLYTDEIYLDYENNKLKTDKNVLIEKEDGSYIKATAMESDIKLEVTKFDNMDIKYYYEEDEEKEE